MYFNPIRTFLQKLYIYHQRWYLSYEASAIYEADGSAAEALLTRETRKGNSEVGALMRPHTELWLQAL